MSGNPQRVECAIEINAEPAVVFEAITAADKLARWWPKGAETDPREGGKVVLWWRDDRTRLDENNRAEATFTTFRPPFEVSYWGVTFMLKPVNGRTRVGITDEVPDLSVASTWGGLRVCLKMFIEQGIDLRPSMGMGGWPEN